MQETMLTLVFMMVFLMFAIWPAIKIVELINRKFEFGHKVQNFLTLIFTVIIALGASLFMQMA